MALRAWRLPVLDAHDLAKVYYNAARAEILQRLALREQVLLAGVTTFGVVAGLAANNPAHSQQMIAFFPLLSLLFTAALFRHHLLIADLGNYINVELGPDLGIDSKPQPGAPAPAMPLHWDAWLSHPHGRNSPPPKRNLRTILFFEFFSSLALLWGPGLAATIWRAFSLGAAFHCDLIFWINTLLLLAATPWYWADFKRLSWGWK